MDPSVARDTTTTTTRTLPSDMANLGTTLGDCDARGERPPPDWSKLGGSFVSSTTPRPVTSLSAAAPHKYDPAATTQNAAPGTRSEDTISTSRRPSLDTTSVVSIPIDTSISRTSGGGASISSRGGGGGGGASSSFLMVGGNNTSSPQEFHDWGAPHHPPPPPPQQGHDDSVPRRPFGMLGGRAAKIQPLPHAPPSSFHGGNQMTRLFALSCDGFEEEEEEDNEQNPQVETPMHSQASASPTTSTWRKTSPWSWMTRVHCVVTVSFALSFLLSIVRLQHSHAPSSTTTTTTTTMWTRNADKPSRPQTSSSSWAPLPSTEQPLRRIAFGSCSNQEMPLAYWDTLSSMKLDLTLLVGNNIHADCSDVLLSSSSKEEQEQSCREILSRAYKNLAAHPSFEAAKSKLSILATMDDSDYGIPHSHGYNNPFKFLAKQLFLDFFHVPRSDARYLRQEEDGVYVSRVFGPPHQRTHIVLLDVRYWRSPFLENKQSSSYTVDYNANTTQQMLSTRQWHWLQEEITNNPANLRLLVTPLPVLTDSGGGGESWHWLYHERQRLYDLIHTYSPLSQTRTLLLSGHVRQGGFYTHYAQRLEEFSGKEGTTQSGDALWEITSSSWTSTLLEQEEEEEEDARRIGSLVRENNFGLLDIDWNTRKVRVSLRRAETSRNGQAHNRPDAGTSLKKMEFGIP